MGGFWRSAHFRRAWVTSLLAGVLFPFLAALLPGEAAQPAPYLARVADGFLRDALSFAAVYCAIQILFERRRYRRDMQNQERPVR